MSRFPLSKLARGRVKATGNEAWADSLDDLVLSLARRWALEPGNSLAGGTESLVLDTIRADGSAAVLKIGVPGR